MTALSLLAPLTLADVVAVAREYRPVAPLRTGENPRLEASAAWVAATLAEVATSERPTPYYAINTGFGDNAGRATFRTVEDAERLSRNLLLSHTVGVGEPLPEDAVRAALLLRAYSLARGYSGVRREVVNTLVAMLNKRVFPVVPARGSLGASGDLAPLAHLVMPLSAPLPGEEVDLPGATGYCFLNGQIVTGAAAMHAAGIAPIRLGAKEGVALINGATVSTAIAALAVHDALNVLHAGEYALALSAEALRGFRDAFLPHIHGLRNAFQAEAAEVVFGYVAGSTLIRGAADIDLDPAEGPPQDPYCIRCAPVVMGAAARALAHIEIALTDEINAATDNPLIFADDDPDSPEYLPRRTKMISGGNFHGAPIGYLMDYLALVMTDYASIAERRIFTLTDPRLNRGLPPFLIPERAGEAGLNSGLMLAQYTAASLVSECKVLAHPASVDSIPSSANREDHVSMSALAARKAAQIVGLVRQVLAIELLCAFQAVHLRLEQLPEARIGAGTAHAIRLIESLEVAAGRRIGVIRTDTPLRPYFDTLDAAIAAGHFAPREDFAE